MEPDLNVPGGTGANRFLPTEEETQQSHRFWDTQPVPRMSTLITKEGQGDQGPIDPPKTVEEVRQKPYSLPDALE